MTADWFTASWQDHADRCTCGPDHTGEAPDERPDCPQHGVHEGPLTPSVSTAEEPY